MSEMERRASRRFNMNLPLTIRFSTGSMNLQQEARTRDVSFRGLYFVIDSAFQAGMPVEFVLTLPKEVTLELPFPTIEAPVEVKDLLKIVDGGWLEPDQQEAAAVDSLRKGIQDALAEIVKGDRSKARDAVSAGPVKIDGVDFALYLGKELAIGATFYDRKHSRDPQKLRTICDVANETVKSALALLKEKPNSDQDKAIKKLQDDLKTVLKNM